MLDLAWSIPDAIHLEIGEPDFSPPQHVLDAIQRSMAEGRGGYPPTAGLPELRDRLVEKVARVNGITTTANAVVVSSGGCQGLFAALSALLDEDDVVALPNPGWPNYRSMVGLLGARVVTYSLSAERHHLPDPAEIERIIDEGAKVVVLCSPSNPTGTVVPPEIVEELVEIVQRSHAWLLSDECYDELYFGPVPPLSPASIAPEGPIVSVYSFSKTHAMTGWRIGYVVCPPGVAGLVENAQEPLVMGVNGPGQYGAIAALEDDEHVIQMREAYRIRRDAVVDAFRSRGYSPRAPDGAFYLWLDISDVTESSDEFVLSLLRDKHVALAAGSSFGDVGRGFIRLSLAAGRTALLTAVERIDEQIRSGGLS